MFDKGQDQKADRGGTALQSGRDLIVISQTGMTYRDVREIAVDAVRESFKELASLAREVASKRAEEITDKYFERLLAENPSAFEHATDPDFQFALRTAQQQFARSGDAATGELLVQLLVDRGKQPKRNLMQLVINEALETVGKLTDQQIAALVTIFALRYMRNHSIGSYEMLGEYLDSYVAPFHAEMSASNASFAHLEFTGCGTASVGAVDLLGVITNSYRGLFAKGLTAEEWVNAGLTWPLIPQMCMPCINDSSLLQIGALNEIVLEDKYRALVDGDEEWTRVLQAFGSQPLIDVKQKCVSLRPYMGSVFLVWEQSPMKSFNLTSVGIAIAHARLSIGEESFADLAIWIN